MRTRITIVSSMGLCLVLASSAVGAITGISLGSEAPPTTLGGLALEPFGRDPAPLFAMVQSAPGPTGPILFHIPVSHRKIGMGWGSWSHGYTGDVYSTLSFDLLTMKLPADTAAFYFYAEPGPFQPYNFTAVAIDQFGGQATVSQVIHGMSGAKGFGFVADGCSRIVSITVEQDAISTQFAVGEFAIARAAGSAPTIDVQPESQAVPTGGTATFTVAATGTGTLTYQWRMGGMALTDFDAMHGTSTATLTVFPAEQSSQGLYDVVITDDCGSMTSAAATLLVALPQDLDLDGDVDGLDLAILLGQWGPCPVCITTPCPCPGDLDGSGTVNGLDLAILLGAWG